MLRNNEQAIEKVFALKLAALNKSDSRWILKRLPKPVSDRLAKTIKSSNSVPVNVEIYKQLASDLEFDNYFKKSNLEKMLEELNHLDVTTVDSFLNEMDETSLKLILLYSRHLSWHKNILQRLKMSSSDYNDYVNKNTNNIEKITNSIVTFSHSALIDSNG